MPKKEVDKFTQLVDDLNSGVLSLRHIQIAFITHIRESNTVPEEAKDILCGHENKKGLLPIYFNLISQLIGSFELVVRRCKDT